MAFIKLIPIEKKIEPSALAGAKPKVTVEYVGELHVNTDFIVMVTEAEAEPDVKLPDDAAVVVLHNNLTIPVQGPVRRLANILSAKKK